MYNGKGINYSTNHHGDKFSDITLAPQWHGRTFAVYHWLLTGWSSLANYACKKTVTEENEEEDDDDMYCMYVYIYVPSHIMWVCLLIDTIIITYKHTHTHTIVTLQAPNSVTSHWPMDCKINWMQHLMGTIFMVLVKWRHKSAKW